MSTAPTTKQSVVHPTELVGRRPMRRAGTVGAAAALVLNAAIWAVGRAADVSFSVTPVMSDSSMEVGIGWVAAGTLVGFGAGWALLAWAGRRSSGWVSTVMISAGVVAVTSASAPLTAAEDTATGVLLACMHVLTGVAFLAGAQRVRR
jgi:hypothetical protein